MSSYGEIRTFPYGGIDVRASGQEAQKQIVSKTVQLERNVKLGFRMWAVLWCVLLLPSCAHVPNESVALSTELGAHVNRLENAHLALMTEFFNKERERVERFFYEEYLPEFSRNYFSDPSIAEGLEMMCSASEPADRLRAMTILSTAAQRELAKRRDALFSPVNEAERELERAIRKEYAVARQMNSAITGLLDSAVEAQGVGNEVLAAFGATPTDVQEAVTKVSQAVSDLTEGAGSAEAKVAEFRSRLGDL